MTHDNKLELKPKLRFPDFQDDGPWESKPLDDICDRIVDKIGDAKLTTVSITAGRGFVSQTEKFGRNIAGAQYKNYILLQRGDFAYNKGNSNVYPQGCVYRLKEFDQAAASNAFICFRLKQGFAPGFIEGLFQKNTHGRQLVRFLTSGARSDGLLNIKPAEFFSVRLPIPRRLAEQHKIADCLSSLDELIAAHGRKLDALKTQKKGLMQRLFPREGETFPRLRFPEFRDKSAWEIVAFGEMGFDVSDGNYSSKYPSQSDFVQVGVPFLRANNLRRGSISDEDMKFISEKQHSEITKGHLKRGDILLSNRGQIGSVALVPDRHIGSNINAQLVRINTGSKSDNVFIFQLLDSFSRNGVFESMSTGTALKQLPIGKLNGLELILPTELKEQRLIASCLSALDDLIAAQTQKLDALKTHKNGLMQQLFPSPDEVEV